MIKKLYDWTMSLAASRHAPLALGAIAFAESSFFPVPPDVILLPMSLAKPQRLWLYAGICTLASVAGGALGYAIGGLLFDTVGQWIIQFYGLAGKMEAVRADYARLGGLIIVAKGFTPIPFKLVTIVSGLMGYNFAMFLGLSFLTRGARFFLIALGIRHYGEAIKDKLERFFGWFLAAMAAIVVVGFVVAAKFL